MNLAAEGWTKLEARGFAGFIGPLWKRIDNGRLRLGLLVDERHVNRAGVIHGGMISSFADTALASGIIEHLGPGPIATIHLGINFVSGVGEGSFIEMVPEIVRATRAVVFVHGIVRAGEQTIATADGIWRRLGDRPAA